MENIFSLKNFIIAVDGIDGSGKTTFINQFRKFIKSKAKKLNKEITINSTSNLKDSKWSSLYAQLNQEDSMSSSSKALIYYALLNQLIEEQLSESEDTVCLMDRSLLTPLVYQSQSKIDLFFKHAEVNLVDPDLIIVFLFKQGSYDRWLERVDSESVDILEKLKNQSSSHQEEVSFGDFFDTINNTYKGFGRAYQSATGNLVLFLDAEDTLEENLENAWAYVYNKFYVGRLDV